MQNQKRKPWKLILLGVALFLVIIVVLTFRVTEITVEGNTFFSGQVVAEEVCNTFLDHNVVTSWIKRKLGFSPTLDWHGLVCAYSLLDLVHSAVPYSFA